MYALTVYCDDGNGKYVDPMSGTYSVERIESMITELLISVATDNVVSFEISKSGE
ncbi:hypothetical protein SEA_GIBBLES_115 [Gordonia phage Gibbles]|nr:hypothetical protein SEA_GIBBLES_115 [Gordonia phage Gibbles]